MYVLQFKSAWYQSTAQNANTFWNEQPLKMFSEYEIRKK